MVATPHRVPLRFQPLTDPSEATDTAIELLRRVAVRDRAWRVELGEVLKELVEVLDRVEDLEEQIDEVVLVRVRVR